MARTNWMASESFVGRVAEFQEIRGLRTEMVGALRAKIAKCDDHLSSLEQMRLEGMDMEAMIMAKLEEKKEYEEQIAALELRKFEWSDADKELHKQFYGDPARTGGGIAIEKWARAYGISMSYQDKCELEEALGGLKMRRKASDRTWVNSGNMTTKGLTRTMFLEIVYRYVRDCMVEKNVLKPCMFSEEVRKFYAPKEKVKKEKSAK